MMQAFGLASRSSRNPIMSLFAESILQVGGNACVSLGLLIVATLFLFCFPRGKIS